MHLKKIKRKSVQGWRLPRRDSTLTGADPSFQITPCAQWLHYEPVKEHCGHWAGLEPLSLSFRPLPGDAASSPGPQNHADAGKKTPENWERRRCRWSGEIPETPGEKKNNIALGKKKKKKRAKQTEHDGNSQSLNENVGIFPENAAPGLRDEGWTGGSQNPGVLSVGKELPRSFCAQCPPYPQPGALSVTSRPFLDTSEPPWATPFHP